MKLIALIIVMTAGMFAQAAEKALPCDPVDHRAFDFWVGDWRVSTADGKHVGDSKIENIQDGCVIRENWRSGQSDFTGTSFNSFNKETGQWEQLWLDNKGGRLHLKGEKKDNQMILSSDSNPDKEGIPTVNRITWTDNEDGSVRQHWEVISEGKPVTTLFDGIYKPVE